MPTLIVPTKWGLAHVLAKAVLLETVLPAMVSYFSFLLDNLTFHHFFIFLTMRLFINLPHAGLIDDTE